MNAVDLHTSDEIRDLYRELILDHARSPRHFGTLAQPTHTAAGINPLCGDKLRLYLEVADDQIRDVSFEGSGCAISVASASLLTDIVLGLDTDRALEYFNAVTARMTGNAGSGDIDVGKLVALDGVREFPSRIKCATLSWHALHAALHHAAAPASTE